MQPYKMDFGSVSYSIQLEIVDRPSNCEYRGSLLFRSIPDDWVLGGTMLLRKSAIALHWRQDDQLVP